MHSRRLPTVPLHLILFLFPPSSMLRSTIPRLFLSLPPWRIPNNPPRDLPPRRLLFLFRSFVSFLPLTFSPHKLVSSTFRIALEYQYCSAPPIIYPSLVTEGCDLGHEFICSWILPSTFRIALEYRLLVRPSHHLPFSLSLGAAILVMSSSVAPTLYLFPSTHRAKCALQAPSTTPCIPIAFDISLSIIAIPRAYIRNCWAMPILFHLRVIPFSY